MQMFLNSYTFSWTIGICMYMQIKLITTANVLKQYIFIDRRFTPNPTQYLIDPLHLIQSGLHLLDDLHVSLLHVFSLPFLSLLITALHLEIKTEKISSFLQEIRLQSMKVFFFQHRHECDFVYLNGLFLFRCHFMFMLGCQVVHFSRPFCLQMVKFYGLAAQCLFKCGGKKRDFK